MDLLHVFLTSIGALVVLFGLTKLMGNRQMSQMSLFDYICGITIGSIAAEMATSLENDFLKPLVAMLVFGLAAAAASVLSCRSMWARRLLHGRPVILLEHGKLYEKNLAAAKLDINEFLTQCRTAGYFDLADIHTAVLETNGQISFLPAALYRPVNPEDLNLQPQPEKPTAAVILDGKVQPDTLRTTGNDDTWLREQLAMQKVARVEDVFLATVDAQNALTIYEKTGERVMRDILE